MVDSEQSGRATLHVRFTCAHCGAPVEFERDGQFLESEETHDCWGDKYGLVAIVDDGINVTDDRVTLEVLTDGE